VCASFFAKMFVQNFFAYIYAAVIEMDAEKACKTSALIIHYDC
jgi:hypothetical protein